jgi:hypothetical protein
MGGLIWRYGEDVEILILEIFMEVATAANTMTPTFPQVQSVDVGHLYGPYIQMVPEHILHPGVPNTSSTSLVQPPRC